MCNNFFPQIVTFMGLMWKKYGQATDGNMAHGLCMLDKQTQNM